MLVVFISKIKIKMKYEFLAGFVLTRKISFAELLTNYQKLLRKNNENTNNFQNKKTSKIIFATYFIV